MVKVGLVKMYDKDLKLYQDIAKTLRDYRSGLIIYGVIDDIKKIRKIHKDLLNRLAFRLNIKTLDISKNSLI